MFEITRQEISFPIPDEIRVLLLDADPDEAKVTRHLERGELHMARKHGAIAGLALIEPITPDTWEIMNCSVQPEFRRQGCGTRLITHVLEVIRNKGALYAELGTADSSPGPIKLYNRCGFTISGIIKNHFRDNYPEPVWDNGVQCMDMIRMRITLQPNL